MVAPIVQLQNVCSWILCGCTCHVAGPCAVSFCVVEACERACCACMHQQCGPQSRWTVHACAHTQGWAEERQALLEEVAVLRRVLLQQQQQQLPGLPTLVTDVTASARDGAGSDLGGATQQGKGGWGGEGVGDEEEGELWDACALPGVMDMEELHAAYTKVKGGSACRGARIPNM